MPPADPSPAGPALPAAGPDEPAGPDQPAGPDDHAGQQPAHPADQRAGPHQPAGPDDHPGRHPGVVLLLVRHGQSEWNVEGRMQGQTAHVPLTALGHAQARSAALELAPLRPGALVSSDLRRAVQTAEHCARATGLPLATTTALREQAYGVLEGRPSRELWDVVDWTDPHWAAEGGESLAQLHDRVAGYLDRLRAQPPADVVALVTHGDTIRAAQAVVAGAGPEAMPAVTPANGSITRLELR